jgi:bromodomain adjacent to zinc finger domain protein 1A
VAASIGNKKLLSEKNIGSDSGDVSHVSRGLSDRMVWTGSEVIDDSDKVTMTKQQPLICTADIISCPVHGQSDSVARTRWAFFSKEEEINHLIECLNRRGIRECELRQTLMQERTYIVQKMANCPVHKLDRTQVSII